MNFGFGKDQDVAASAALTFAAPKIHMSIKSARNRRHIDRLGFNLWDRGATSVEAFPTESALPDRAVSLPVFKRRARKPSSLLFERRVSGNLDAILAEMVEDTVILAVSRTMMAPTQDLSMRKMPKRAEYSLIRHENRGNGAVPAVASTAEYVVKNAAKSPELDVNQGMVPPEKHGVVSASALARRRR